MFLNHETKISDDDDDDDDSDDKQAYNFSRQRASNNIPGFQSARSI